MKKLILATIVGVICIVGALALKVGAFRPVVIRDEQTGPFRLVSKPHTGAYHKIVETIEEVETWGARSGARCEKTFGEYFDNPEQVEEGRLRSRGGCLWSESARPDDIHLEMARKDGFEVSVWDKRRAYIATFDGSPSIGPLKVYPRVMKEISAHGLSLAGSVIEIYRINNDRTTGETTYVFPVK